MTEYMNTDAVVFAMKCRCTRDCPGDCDNCVTADIARALNGIRPLQIITCEECIHFVPLKGRCHWGYCRCMKVDVRCDEFCARGRNRDGAHAKCADL